MFSKLVALPLSYYHHRLSALCYDTEHNASCSNGSEQGLLCQILNTTVTLFFSFSLFFAGLKDWNHIGSVQHFNVMQFSSATLSLSVLRTDGLVSHFSSFNSRYMVPPIYLLKASNLIYISFSRVSVTLAVFCFE